MKIAEMTDKKTIIILQGGSGSGKSSVTRYLTELGIPKVVTCTTRKPKVGEKDKVDYYFYESKEELLATELIECAEYSGNWYGTGVEEINSKLREFNTICTVMEKEGAKKLKEAYPSNVIIISFPIEKEIMKANLEKRQDNKKLIDERLVNADKLHEDVAWDYADYVLTGNNLENKYERVNEILKERNIIK